MGAKLGELRYNLDQANLEDFDINPEHIGHTQEKLRRWNKKSVVTMTILILIHKQCQSLLLNVSC